MSPTYWYDMHWLMIKSVIFSSNHIKRARESSCYVYPSINNKLHKYSMTSVRIVRLSNSTLKYSEKRVIGLKMDGEKSLEVKKSHLSQNRCDSRRNIWVRGLLLATSVHWEKWQKASKSIHTKESKNSRNRRFFLSTQANKLFLSDRVYSECRSQQLI